MSAARKSFLAIGECMIEMAGDPSGLWRMGFAGDTLNTAWYFRKSIRRDRVPTWDVNYFTHLGEDRYSARIIEFLEACEIGASRIGRDPARQPGLYLIDLEKGERSFVYWRGQSAARLLADDEALIASAVGVAEIVYFSGITLAILAPDRRDFLVRLIGEARRAGKMTVFDSNIRPRLWENPEAMRAAIIAAAGVSSAALPSFEDERSLFGDTAPEACARRYREAGCDEVVVKTGGGAICLATRESTVTIDDLERVEPVDTTGAGDAFNGAYLARRAEGEAPIAAARYAHGVASRVVRHHGALVDPAMFQ
jgi:2-dehydro-3-deoxygluconokinase